MEWAFRGPESLRERLGDLDAPAIAAMDAEELEAAFRQKPALHRYPAAMAKRLGRAPKGWEEAAAPFSDDEPRSVADIDSPEALERVRAWKKAMKARGKSKADEA